MSSPEALIEELEEALERGTDERRAKTLRRITDLFAFGSSHFSGDHVALFDGIISRLIVDIESSARAALADRLATIPNAPPGVVRKLAFDEAIDVAGPVLKKSDALDNATLVENASTMGQPHLLAISNRKTLPDTITDVLVERGNRDVALSTVRNKGAKFSEAGYLRLVKRSEGDDELAQSVGSRPEIPRHHFLKLLTKASHAVRLKLEAANPQFAAEIQEVIAEVATTIQAKAAATSRDYIAARAQVESLQAAGRLTERDVEAFAQAGKFEETTVALAMMSGMPTEVVERAIVHEQDGTILIVAKAAGFSWPTLKAILLMRAGKSGVPVATLETNMANFARLKRETARMIIEFQRKRQGAPAASATGSSE